MDTSVVDASITSRKRKTNEEEVAELEETTFIVLSVVTMLLGVMAWYHDKYFVKKPARNWELERRNYLNRLYRGTKNDCIEQKGQLTCANKSRDKEGIMNSMREVAESLKEFAQVSTKKLEGNAQEVVQEVLNEMKMILDLDNAVRYKAIASLTANPNKLAILKALPLGEKKDFISAFMS